MYSATASSLLKTSPPFVLSSYIAGGEEDLQVGAGRILTGSWFLTALVVSAAYSGSLVADLSVTRRQTLFRSLEDVVNQDEYKWGTLGNASTHIMIMVRKWSPCASLSTHITINHSLPPLHASHDKGKQLHLVTRPPPPQFSGSHYTRNQTHFGSSCKICLILSASRKAVLPSTRKRVMVLNGFIATIPQSCLATTRPTT